MSKHDKYHFLGGFWGVYLPYRNKQKLKAMKVQKLTNGQYQVTDGNLTLTQTVINGTRFNDCTIMEGDFYESISQHSEKMRPLFIALHNYKNNEN
jgi:ribosome biogenesis SPOUT family RNA methylase Rps3